MLEEKRDDRFRQHQQAQRSGHDECQDKPQPQAQCLAKPFAIPRSTEAGQGGQHGHRDGYGYHPVGQLDQRGGSVHPGNTALASRGRQSLIDGHLDVADDQSQGNGHVKDQDAAQGRIRQVQPEAKSHPAQGWNQDEKLEERAQKHTHRQTVSIQAAGEQRGGDDDAQIKDGGTKSGEGEALERVQQAAHHAREAEKEHRWRDNAQHPGQGGLQLWLKATTQQPGELGRKGFQQQDDASQHHGHQAQHPAKKGPQCRATLLLGNLAKNRHQRCAEHAADKQFVDHLGDFGRDAKGTHQATGTEEIGDDLLADQPKYAAGDVAQGNDAGSLGNTSGLICGRGRCVLTHKGQGPD